MYIVYCTVQYSKKIQNVQCTYFKHSFQVEEATRRDGRTVANYSRQNRPSPGLDQVPAGMGWVAGGCFSHELIYSLCIFPLLHFLQGGSSTSSPHSNIDCWCITSKSSCEVKLDFHLKYCIWLKINLKILLQYCGPLNVNLLVFI